MVDLAQVWVIGEVSSVVIYGAWLKFSPNLQKMANKKLRNGVKKIVKKNISNLKVKMR